jgi:hypothetical protein
MLIWKSLHCNRTTCIYIQVPITWEDLQAWYWTMLSGGGWYDSFYRPRWEGWFEAQHLRSQAGWRSTASHAEWALRAKTWTAKRAKCACYKCGQGTCRGSSRIVLCNNPCRDCNQANCEGRSTAHPDLPCGGGIWSLSGWSMIQIK